MYKSLKQCLNDLEDNGHLLRICEEVDPYLEMAAIHRRVHAINGPALLFEKVKGSPFPAVSNLFGTSERVHFMFRETLPGVKSLIQLKKDPLQAIHRPLRFRKTPLSLIHALPQKVRKPQDFNETTLGQLPQIQSWPGDGGPFITLPQVLSRAHLHSSLTSTNLGMYRIQLSGNRYQKDVQAGLHYQIHRGIGIHHSAALQRDEPFKVSIFIGGPPAHTLAAVMPLPEGISELVFAGTLAGRRFRYFEEEGWIVSADADFNILGTVEQQLLPEGPFGDHLGYYSLEHDFPVLKIHKVYHRKPAIWPFTVVGRPPQEDSMFGKIIHELTGPLLPETIPGLKAVNAVDSAGVHPLLLAVGSERYMPYADERQPMELLTIANAILGFGQLSLAKYLLIAAGEDEPAPDVNHVPKFFSHVLERVDWSRDVHFQTSTTIDTLDYSGTRLNHGSKVVFAAAGKPRRPLIKKVPAELKLPRGFGKPVIALPGILVIRAPKFISYEEAAAQMYRLTDTLKWQPAAHKPAMIVLADDSAFCAASPENFVWVTFTRSNPANDIYGVGSFTKFKHWGCYGPLIIDARSKPHHAPVLEEDPEISRRVDRFFRKSKGLIALQNESGK